ncbi:MAG: hypothetical protein ACK5XS_01375 [Armatimonadota bacterium]|jgi:hypothetical protein|nr:hypothetical protein [Fimbriimonadaceae bacterium]MCZ8139386.1 hypothetical protein [Fimbriimonadaceae bacterium]
MSSEDKVEIVDVKDSQVSWRPNSRIYLLALPIALSSLLLKLVTDHDDEELQLGFALLILPFAYPVTAACVVYSIFIFKRLNTLKLPIRILLYIVFLVNAYLLYTMAKFILDVSSAIIALKMISYIAL